ncbi:MAG: hypothetical protein U0103_04415 [Candidatus Obscuribacterales bacterium]
MVESNSFTDVSTVNANHSPDVEHTNALKALQSEIEYHRKVVTNNTYLENIVSFVYDGGRSESLHKLELAYEQEQQKPNSSSRQELTKLLKDDQSTLNAHLHIGSTFGIIETGLAIFGGSKGKMVATGLLTLSTMHPNDSFGNQAVEAIAGLGLGSAAAWGFDKGGAMKNQILSIGTQALAYPLASQLSRIQWPNQGTGDAPDINKIYSSNLSSRIDSASLNSTLDRPQAIPAQNTESSAAAAPPPENISKTSDWNNFSIMK